MILFYKYLYFVLNFQDADEVGSIAGGDTGDAGEKVLTLEEQEDLDDEAVSKQILDLQVSY